ncbi:MAG: phosphoribosylformylglycinamidine synthase subunit PurQ [Pseudomonadales bacterium]|nr:phosphoribosylformylglycinamidine synthase subunit PurQ [Pseudomonadales bacterium]
MRFAIIRFPGTWSDRDCAHILQNILGQKADILWHKEENLEEYDVAILPGGFSYGDYLRCGSIAQFSPIMKGIEQFASSGRAIIGICNGFQILCESNLLPGALIRNNSLKFRCEPTYLRSEGGTGPWMSGIPAGEILSVPISHGEGNYQADTETLIELEENQRIAFRYCSENGEVNAATNPNGSANNIAGIVNAAGNILGMMPHPERAGEAIIGGTDGNQIWESVIKYAIDKTT